MFSEFKKVKTIDELLTTNFNTLKKKEGDVYIEYLDVASSFDIETSSFYNRKNEKQAIMYAYVFGINGVIKIGRSWSEFKEDISKVIDFFKLSINKRLIVFVHNLEFEFQFIRKRFNWYKVFSIENRRPIYAITTDGIEFRCSYLLTNLSLEKVAENITIYKIKKMVGDLDYLKVRSSSTPLTDEEIGYIENDGYIVMGYIEQLRLNENGITNLPLTNTGFVRNECRFNCLYASYNQYRSFIRFCKLTPSLYEASKRAFQGGFTHANAYRVGHLNSEVASYDLTSSYPTCLIAEKYPCGVPSFLKTLEYPMFKRFLSKFLMLFDIELENIEEKFKYDNYISTSKCEILEGPIVNNGRLVKGKRIKTTITNIDFEIIEKCYKWSSIKVTNIYVWIGEYLPKDFIKTILEYYKIKTTLKDVEGKEYEYMKSKNRLNSFYGMCVQDPCKDVITYDNIDEWGIDTSKSEEELIENYNKNKNRFLYYLWGIFNTAYARRNVWNGIFELKLDYIYSDTDSLKFVNYLKHKKFFDEYNKTILNKLEMALDYHKLSHEYIYPKNKKGLVKPLGVRNFEGIYTRFKTLGAKRYIYEENKEITITISGVSKKVGKEFLKARFKNNDEIFSNFHEGLYFPSYYTILKDGSVKELKSDELKKYKKVYLGSGKNTHTYLDEEQKGTFKDYLGNTFQYDELSSIHLEATSYNMSFAKDFINYLLGIKLVNRD